MFLVDSPAILSNSCGGLVGGILEPAANLTISNAEIDDTLI
jgi:hypothetical protein